MHLPAAIFGTVVRYTPLVSIDLVVRDRQGRMLVGRRKNRPAQDTWFVPGGRIAKGESLEAAFARITWAELGRSLARRSARLLGAFDHFYADNALGEPDYGTHYVVLAHALVLDPESLPLPREQHGAYRWIDDTTARTDPAVHANTRAYVGL